MKKKKFLALLMAAVIAGGCVPPQATARAGPNEEEQDVEDPYSTNLADLIKDRQDVIRDRADADRQYNENLNQAETSIKDMEKVKDHLDTQKRKYPDYDKIDTSQDNVDSKIDEAKELLMETTGSASTGEYRFGVEVAPDAESQSEANDRFSKISVLADETRSEDMTVDKYRGFYDLSKTRKKIVKKALSEKGKISYLWGGKSLSKETPKALDCSGFVRWVYHYATGKSYDTMISTASVGKNYSEITHDELKPGDVGMKNEEGTCFVSADGDKFDTKAQAVDDNRAHNDRIQKKIKKVKANLKDDIKEIKDNKKADIKKIKSEKDDKDRDDTKAAGTEDRNTGTDEVVKTKVSDTTDTFTLDTADTDEPSDKIVKKQKISDATDQYTLENKPERVLTKAEKLAKAGVTAEKAIKALKKDAKSDIKELKAKLVNEQDVSHQIGHIGIYAGRDKDGNDTWVHCTGGSRDTVVVTTEAEYDGFKYYYSPLNGTKDAEQKAKDVSIRTSSGLPEADYEVQVPGDLDYWGTKTYERYTAIRAKQSLQYKLEQQAWTNPSGFRQVNDRYLIAVGTGVTSDIGKYVDLVLENGTTIPCIIGDIKADIHTDRKYHIMTRASHCVSEFIVDGDLIKASIGGGGDISAYTSYWDSPVQKFIVYKNRAIR